MTVIEMPALDGRNPLGFLAALGLLRVLDKMEAIRPRLSFSRDGAMAQLHSQLDSIDEVAEKLRYFVGENPSAAVAGLDARFPMRAGQKGGDPMRQPRAEYRELVRQIDAIDPHAATEWMPCTITDLAIDSQGRADLTPFCAPSGKQSLRTFFEKPLAAVRADPSCLRDALEMWRRVEGFTGEYLDHRVINSAADDPAGRAGTERGVPGATWLATMAVPLLRVAGDGSRVSATLWYRVGRRQVMLWPLWHQPLGLAAVRVMIEHPCLSPVDEDLSVSSGRWPALGIFAVYGAERQGIPARKFAGVLAPTPVQVRPD